MPFKCLYQQSAELMQRLRKILRPFSGIMNATYGEPITRLFSAYYYILVLFASIL